MGGGALHVLNLVMQRAMMFNNYGRHVHNFQAKATGFSWDWLNFPGAMTAAFCISINGALLCGLRGLPGSVDRGAQIFTGSGDLEVGEGFGLARRMAQVTHHPLQDWRDYPEFLQ